MNIINFIDSPHPVYTKKEALHWIKRSIGIIGILIIVMTSIHYYSWSQVRQLAKKYSAALEQEQRIQALSEQIRILQQQQAPYLQTQQRMSLAHQYHQHLVELVKNLQYLTQHNTIQLHALRHSKHGVEIQLEAPSYNILEQALAVLKNNQHELRIMSMTTHNTNIVGIIKEFPVKQETV